MASSNDLKLTLRFNADNKEFIGAVKSNAKALDSLDASSSSANAELNELATGSNKAEAGLSALKKQALGLVGGFSALSAAINAKDQLAKYQDIRTQISGIVGGQEQWAETEAYLSKVADEHNKTLVGMAGNYARLATLQEAGLMTQREMRSIFEGMSNAQSSTAATTEQLGQSMYGLAQALASPIVRAEELNQVVEPIPGLLNKLDKAAGLSAGGFRQMMLAGGVTSEFFKTTLITALEDYDGAAAATADNISAKQAMQMNSYQQMVVAYEQPISTVFIDSMDAAVSVMQVFHDNAETVTTVIGVSLAAALGRGTAAMTANTAASIKSVIATRQEIQTTIEQTTATLAETRAEIANLEAMQLNNNQKFRAIGAEAQLTAAKAAETVQTNLLTAAQTRLNVVARAGATVMGLLGGPLGIAMTAASAIAYFAMTADDAKPPTHDFTNEINDLVIKFQSLDDAGKKIEFDKLKAESDEAKAALEKTNAEIKSLKNNMTLFALPGQIPTQQSDIKELEKQAQELQQTIDGTTQKIAALKKVATATTIKPVVTGQSDADKVQKTAERMLANMQKQVALYGDTSEVAKVTYEIQHGGLVGINDELKKQLLLQASIIDKQNAQNKKTKKTKPTEKKTDKIDAFYKESDELNNAWQLRLAMEADAENKAIVQENYAYADRQSNLEASYQQALTQAKGNAQQMAALEKEYFNNRELLHAEHEANITQIKEQQEAQRKKSQEEAARLTLTYTQQMLSITTSGLQKAGKEQSAAYRVLFAAQKAAAIPSMIVATEEAATKALSLGPVAGPIASGATKALGYASIGIVAGQALAGQAHDGINRVPKENEGTWMLKANEMVLNPTQADNFRWMVNMMQSMQASASAAASYANASSGGASNINVASPPVSVVFVDNESQLNAYMKSSQGEKAVMKIVKRNKTQL